MRILMVTPEANPFARSGGLAEVIYALAWTLVKQGHEVRVVLPSLPPGAGIRAALELNGSNPFHPVVLEESAGGDLYLGA